MYFQSGQGSERLLVVWTGAPSNLNEGTKNVVSKTIAGPQNFQLQVWFDHVCLWRWQKLVMASIPISSYKQLDETDSWRFVVAFIASQDMLTAIERS